MIVSFYLLSSFLWVLLILVVARISFHGPKNVNIRYLEDSLGGNGFESFRKMCLYYWSLTVDLSDLHK